MRNEKEGMNRCKENVQSFLQNEQEPIVQDTYT